jgi:NitT/TauT family transport system permease protein
MEKKNIMKKSTVVRAIFPHAFLWGIIGLVLGLPDIQAVHIITKLPLVYSFVGWSVLLGLVLAVAATRKFRHLMPDRVLRTYNICSIFIFFVFIWELVTNKLPLLDPFVFVSPIRVCEAFVTMHAVLIRSIFSSMDLLLWGFFVGMPAGMISALIIGWFKPVFNVAYPFAKIVAPIPPPIYIPFFIVAFPVMRWGAIAIVFIGAFWPTFATTCFAAYAFDRRYIEAAQMMGAKSSWSLIWRVIYPGVKPEIFTGVFVSLILAFVMLIVAEMVGASSGLGFYLHTQRLLSHYPEVLAGIITIGLVVVTWLTVFDAVEKRSLKWQAIS